MDTIQNTIDSLTVAMPTTEAGPNVWMIIAVVEFIVILVLLLSRGKSDDAKARAKREVLKEGEIDFGNIIASPFHAEALYTELIRKCHPDRFAPDKEKMELANNLSTRITQSRRDLRALQILKEEAQTKLNINL